MKHTEPPPLEVLSKKGSDRIQINNILCAVCVGALSVLLGLSSEKLSAWAIGQLGVAVPFLVTSSLAYAKTAYRNPDEFEKWDNLGWLTHTIGYAGILNAILLMLYHNKFILVAWLLIASIVSLFIVYSVLDLHLKRQRTREKVFKLIFFFLLLLLGAVLPITAKWV